MGLLAAAGIKIGGAILGGFGKRKAAKKQKSAAREGRDIAYANIETQRKQNDETMRRTKQQVARNEGTAVASSAAGGFALGGQNAQSVLGSIKSENAKQLDWLALSDQTQLDTMKSEADYNYSAGKAQASATNWSAAGSAVDAVSGVNEMFPKVIPNLFGFKDSTKAI